MSQTNGKHPEAGRLMPPTARFYEDEHKQPELEPVPFGTIIKAKRKKEGVAFDDDIPLPGPEVYILRMKGNRCLTFTIWAVKIRGIWIHWRGTHSEPHYRDEEHCPGCQSKQEKRWKGFLHCYCSEMKQEVFLELTPTSAHSLRAQLAGRASMRGGVIQVRRTAAENGRLYISTLTPVSDTSMLPPEKDPRPSILRLWGVKDEQAEQWLGMEGEGDERASFS